MNALFSGIKHGRYITPWIKGAQTPSGGPHNGLNQGAMTPEDVDYGIFRVNHILCKEECKNA